MKTMVRLGIFAVVFAACFAVSSQQASWSYHDEGTGPANWPSLNPGCGGTKQSPINIETERVEKRELGSFDLTGFGNDVPQGASMTVFNTGHSIEVELNGNYLIGGGGLGPNVVYQAIQFHFHWGSVNDRGSEHTINGKQYAGEIHIVAYNKKYPDVSTALDNDDGLAVLGFFVEVQSEDNPALTRLFDAISNVKFEDDRYELSPPLPFTDWMPSDLTDFYRYSGSLTTPTCNEVVTWTVFSTPVMVSEAQLTVLRESYGNYLGDPMNLTISNNYRPVQPLNGRTVYKNENGYKKETWSYLTDETGPDSWPTKYPGCNGKKQSPINFVTTDTVSASFGAFTLVGFGSNDKPQGASMAVLNNGHTVQVTTEGDYLVSEGGLGDNAHKVVQFHFHWGGDNSRGSEHTVDGKMYPAELHIVTYNTKYPNVSKAIGYADGIAALGFFVDIQSEDNPAFSKLFDAISKVQFEDDESLLSLPLVFNDLLPMDLTTFYRYSGSLTTPICNEVVTWTVFAEPIMISEAQINTLRRQYSNYRGAPKNITLTNTYRPVQALNGRKVYLNTASSLIASSVVVMVTVAFLTSVLSKF